MSFSYKNLKKLYLTGYRSVGFTMLVATLGSLICYTFIMIFFMFNTTWISPTVLSETSDRMLQFRAGYQTAVQQNQTAEISFNDATRQVDALTKNQKSLIDLHNDLSSAIAAEEKYASMMINENTNIKTKRINDIEESKKLQSKLLKSKLQIEQSLMAGLITASDAVRELSAIQNFDNAITVNQEAVLIIDQRNNILNRGRSTFRGKSTSVDAAKAMLIQSEVSQKLLLISNELETAKETAKAASNQLSITTKSLEVIKESSFMAAMGGGSYLAFVPYDNFRAASVGSPVYDCYLMVVFCHKVATIRKIYGDEQIIDFPIYNVRLTRTARGFMVDLDVEDTNAMHSLLLFAGRKPFFI